MKARRLLARARGGALLAAVLMLAFTAPARPQAAATIHVITVPIDSGAEIFYAKELGFFAKVGLNVEISTAPNGGAAAAAVAGNAVDIGYADTVSVSSAVARGVSFVVIAPAALHISNAPTTVLMVAANSPIKTAKDLNGKTIAGSGLGTISGFAPRAWIEQNGGDLSTVKFVELAFPAMVPALDAGRIDAAAIAEPFLTQAKKTERVLASPYDSVAKTFIVSAFFTSSEWAGAHPDLVRRFISAIHETALWANKTENRQRSAEILVQYAKVDPALISAMTRVRYGDVLTPALLQPVVNLATKYGNGTPFRAEKLIYVPGK